MSRIRLRDSVQFPVWSIHFIMTPPHSGWHYTNQTKLFLFSWKMTLSQFVEVHFFSRIHFAPTRKWGKKAENPQDNGFVLFAFQRCDKLPTFTACGKRLLSIVTSCFCIFGDLTFVKWRIWSSKVHQTRHARLESEIRNHCFLPVVERRICKTETQKIWSLRFFKLFRFIRSKLTERSDIFAFVSGRGWQSAGLLRKKACGECRCVSGSWLTEHLAAITAHL